MHWSAFRKFVPSAIGRSRGWGVDCWRGAKRRKPTLIVLSSHRCCTKMQYHEWSPPWWWWWWSPAACLCKPMVSASYEWPRAQGTFPTLHSALSCTPANTNKNTLHTCKYKYIALLQIQIQIHCTTANTNTLYYIAQSTASTYEVLHFCAIAQQHLSSEMHNFALGRDGDWAVELCAIYAFEVEPV